MRRAIAVFCLLISLAASTLAQATAAADPAFTSIVLPAIARTCVGCHGGAEHDGGLDLTRVVKDGPAAIDLRAWKAVRSRVALHEMPPASAKTPPPTAQVRAAITSFVDRRLKDAAASRPEGGLDPGRTTLRRLSRYEYANTVRDVLGASVRPEESLPPDDLGHGFDNVADALTMTPLLFEKYAAAAERIAADVVVDEDPAHPRTVRFEAEAMECELDRSVQGGFRVLYSNAAVVARFDAPRDGVYVFRARVCGDQAGPELPRVSFQSDGRGFAALEVKETRRDPKVYEVRSRLLRGRHAVGVAFPNDFFDGKHPDKTKRDRNLAVDWVEIAGPVDERELPRGHREIFAGDDPARAPKDRAVRILEPLLLRLYRRPASIDERDRLATLVAKAVSEGRRFEGGVRLALAAALTSPHFLFRRETDPPGGPRTRPLDAFEAATRLSYFLWASAPDAPLLEDAARRRVFTPEDLRRHAERMLDDPRASALAESFAPQWLELRNLTEASPDPTRFPTFDEGLRTAMRREAELLFEAVLRERRPAFALVDADFTFVNEPLARHYGLPGIFGPEFRRVRTPDARRGGVSSMAGVLTVTSNPTRTSPVKRGKWLLDNLLDAPPTPPPPGVGAIEEGKEPLRAASLREKLEQHRADASCASCHTRMDALGFALENYDAVGGWRDQDGGVPVDAGGALPDGRTIRGPLELKAILKSDRAFLRALSKKLLIYAVGRGLSEDDATAIEEMTEAMPKDGALLRDLILGVVGLDAFRLRRTTP